MKHPIDSKEWIDSSELDPNFWNPNVVFTPELKLLERSILKNGWIFPIIVNENNMIIDGYHRHWLSTKSKEIKKRDKGRVPIVRLDVDDAEAMLITVQMNRAKGTHVAERMSHLIKRLVREYGMTEEEVADGIGGTKEEIRLLLMDDIFKHRNLDKYEYSKAWVPIEVTDEERKRMIDDGVSGAQIYQERDDDLAPDEVDG